MCNVNVQSSSNEQRCLFNVWLMVPGCEFNVGSSHQIILTFTVNIVSAAFDGYLHWAEADLGAEGVNGSFFFFFFFTCNSECWTWAAAVATWSSRKASSVSVVPLLILRAHCSRSPSAPSRPYTAPAARYTCTQPGQPRGTLCGLMVKQLMCLRSPPSWWAFGPACVSRSCWRWEMRSWTRTGCSSLLPPHQSAPLWHSKPSAPQWWCCTERPLSASASLNHTRACSRQ